MILNYFFYSISFFNKNKTFWETKLKPFEKLITTFWETHSTMWTPFLSDHIPEGNEKGIIHPKKGELDNIPVRCPIHGVRSHLTGFFIARPRSSYIRNRPIPHRALGDLTLPSSSRRPWYCRCRNIAISLLFLLGEYKLLNINQWRQLNRANYIFNRRAFYLPTWGANRSIFKVSNYHFTA